MSDAADGIETTDGKNPTRLRDVAYDDLKERLIRGAFAPGTKLTVRGVADELGVSSTPAREAINRLTQEGALVFAGPKTVIVPSLTREALDEVTAMRLALEGLAAFKGAPNATQETITQLQTLQQTINERLDKRDYVGVLASNREFHFALYQLSEMPNLVATIETLWLRTGAAFHDLYPEFAENRFGVHNHLAAIESLVIGDAEGVRAAIESDIRDGYRRLRRVDADRIRRQSTT
ncbi:GntR family transcriptional regulator [Ensifer sp. SL37]|uniref:GntR family transcriptional regulator n=1 Tax=Ensifer sp. SL37 TaxID=2995137 RepID=UPI0022745A52|nr:GntR family transcriptional regulator [Ensifer sp. SL37]MCY1746389.1 GntR family transcriptional regulator [Ensifer sp. SL37]